MGKYGRGALFLSVITLLFYVGIYLQGQLFDFELGFFGILKFVADAATGLLYLLGKLFGLGQGDIRSYGYEYGNTYLYTAGLLNMLLIVDTFDIAQGRKP